ncbi:MAG: hypothetical protein GC164_05320 [Phycisphaera sp.]|nr:hypothetical protein [Phycisphaera sp.]
MSRPTHHDWLKQLTELPTAAGCEGRVVEWVEHWVAQRKRLKIERDRFGNLTIRQRKSGKGQPIYFTAHMDHPAFVVRRVRKNRLVEAEFRGGVQDAYFMGAKVVWIGPDGSRVRGRVVEFEPAKQGQDKSVVIEMKGVSSVRAGDVVSWDVGRSRIVGDRLHAPACDDLAGLAAALCALDELGRGGPNVRVLLTRAEEVGFVGAIAACKAGTVPRGARLICLENSRSFAESPIGGGPIVRVGDRTSTFHPGLTYRIGELAKAMAAHDRSFKWQRRLMVGGTCEASAFCEYGYEATCLCLPLGNYHNMSDPVRGRHPIKAETVSVSDFDGLVRLLVASAKALSRADRSQPFRAVLERLFASRHDLLASG